MQYRKKDGNNSGWFEVNAYNEYAKIIQLEENTTYEYRVGGQCGYNGGYTFSRIFEFTTGIRGDNANFTCGVTPEIYIANQEPLPQIGRNEIFTAGEFPVTVKEVDGVDGVFSGWGYIVVPYLKDTRIKIGFDRIFINTDYQMTEGILVTDYDPNWEGVVNVNEVIDAFGRLFDEINELLENYSGTEEEQALLEQAQEDAESLVNDLVDENESSDTETQDLQQALDQFRSDTDTLLEEEENPSGASKESANNSKDKLYDALNDYAEGINAENTNNTNITGDDYFDGVLPFQNAPTNLSTGLPDQKTIDISSLFSDDYAKRKDSLSATIGVNKTLYITNSFASSDKIEKIKTLLANPDNNQYYLWQHYDLEKNELKYKIAFGANFFGSLDINQKGYIEIFNDLLSFNIREFIGIEVVKMSNSIDLLLDSYKNNPFLSKELAEGYTTYDLLKLFVAISKQCGDDFAKQTQGIVPRCVWNQDFNPAVAYYAGFIDGAWETIEGVAGMAKFAGAWSVGNPIFYTNEGAKIRQETVNMVILLGELYSSEAKRSQTKAEIEKLFDQYIDNVSSLNPQGRYLQGKLIFDIAGCFIGITEIKAFIKTGQLTSRTLKGLQKLAKSGKKLALVLGRKIKVDKNKIVTYLMAANQHYEIARFADDGVLIAENWIDKPIKIIDNIGDIPYRKSNNAAENIAEIGVVKDSQGKVGLGLLKDLVKIDIRPDDLNHIFASKKPYKLIKSDANIKLLKEIASNRNNLRKVDSYGKEWFTKIRKDGSEIYIYVKDGYIKGAGINLKPRFKYGCQ